MTGDYVDNIRENEEVGNQNLKDWTIYNIRIHNILDRYKIKVIYVSGNYAQWAVDIYNSKENHFLDYSFSYNRTKKNASDFFLRKIIKVIKLIAYYKMIIDTQYNGPPYGLIKKKSSLIY